MIKCCFNCEHYHEKPFKPCQTLSSGICDVTWETVFASWGAHCFEYYKPTKHLCLSCKHIKTENMIHERIFYCQTQHRHIDKKVVSCKDYENGPEEKHLQSVWQWAIEKNKREAKRR